MQIPVRFEGEWKMPNGGEEKPNEANEDSQRPSDPINQEQALPEIEKMTPEETRSYLDDLFRSTIFSEG